MPSRRRQKPGLGIVELAVDPADVDRETYPVRIRLTRPLTAYEVEGATQVADHLRVNAQERHGSHMMSQSADDRGLH